MISPENPYKFALITVFDRYDELREFRFLSLSPIDTEDENLSKQIRDNTVLFVQYSFGNRHYSRFHACTGFPEHFVFTLSVVEEDEDEPNRVYWADKSTAVEYIRKAIDRGEHMSITHQREPNSPESRVFMRSGAPHENFIREDFIRFPDKRELSRLLEMFQVRTPVDLDAVQVDSMGTFMNNLAEKMSNLQHKYVDEWRHMLRLEFKMDVDVSSPRI